ncbi:MBL fold metallo-hydrolase [Sandaracinobacter neustonicus]|uniref:MBL fold metallo-hydrolase n=1 Tax=Sandaracinobacter neustonicus TaxID=1715348 RepID=A0A501XQR9_9SPHN|nr:MBL fold metallo-hydrolase [Sandaracinobacter neustonicus]TPE62900.1 MBL fold metallo-hydrolase [Sandaracinobacter neustonicus]
MRWRNVLLTGLALLAVCGVALVHAADPGPPDIPVSDHFNGERFTMPDGRMVGDKPPGELLRWLWSRKPAPWPEHVPVTPAIPVARVEGEQIVATMVGHASVLLQTQGLNILTDPIWAERATPIFGIGPARATAPGIRFEDLPKIDLVLLSHGHWDHMDLPTLKRLWERDRALILTPLGHKRLLSGEGIEATELDWGGVARVGPLSVVAEPVEHWTSRWILDRNRALWAGWTILAPGGSIYFAGDSGYGDGNLFRAVRRHGPVRLALLPVGAYEPRWFMADQHMNPAEAVKAMADLDAAQALGLHWGTFQLTDEAREAPKLALAAELAKAGVAGPRFPALAAGEVLELPAVARACAGC